MQWIASERRKQSVVPVQFWYFSVGGGLMLLAYAIYRHDPVFILGQGAGLFVYARNLYFIHASPRVRRALSWSHDLYPQLPGEGAARAE